MKRQSSLLILALSVLDMLVIAAGCDSYDEEQASHVRVLLTDAPLDDIAAANVVISRVELHGEGVEIVLTDEPQPFDLLTLQNGLTAELADIEVPNGTYHQLRIIVDEEATVEYTDGTEEALKVPSGTHTGIKVPLPSLELNNDVVEVTVDFDVTRSFVKRGNSGKGYLFKPVLRPLSLTVDGEEIELGADDIESEEENESGDEG